MHKAGGPASLPPYKVSQFRRSLMEALESTLAKKLGARIESE
jgi:hypothetical protein